MSKYTLNTLNSLRIIFKKPTLVFLYGDLGSGKTTLTKYCINNILGKDIEVTSPTYTYYNKIEDLYHFDLYRLENYEEFTAIGGEEILDNNNGIVFIEWPDILEGYYVPDISIHISKTEIEGERDIKVIYK